ncbi:hypothetical protein OOJ91_13795 [Micromonospora lupini]|uniref:hypothetical protein n=1 Tax=Micromonospora lupini TaxID=285679 RepID=UPI0022503ADF|nr:hypothetical protein [Micromonospora lupini]MCX5066920.1 hypothetical protein [Micromonospora lupini]
MTNPCAHCGRPQPDTAHACQACTDRAYRDLHDLADATPAARDVATGQARHTTGAGGGSHEGRIPLDLGATAKLDAVQNEITTWARVVADNRHHDQPIGPDLLIAAARWLAGHLDFIRRQPYAVEAYRGFRAAAAIVRGVATGPTERRWLGQCGADLDDDRRCTADLHARVGARVAVCRACGTRHAVAERRAFLDGQTADQAYTARQISLAYPQIPEGTIRSWAKRGEIVAELDPLPDGVEGPLWVHRDPGGRPRPRYVLGEVLALAERKAMARAEREARQAEATPPEAA